MTHKYARRTHKVGSKYCDGSGKRARGAVTLHHRRDIVRHINVGVSAEEANSSLWGAVRRCCAAGALFLLVREGELVGHVRVAGPWTNGYAPHYSLWTPCAWWGDLYVYLYLLTSALRWAAVVVEGRGIACCSADVSACAAPCYPRPVGSVGITKLEYHHCQKE